MTTLILTALLLVAAYPTLRFVVALYRWLNHTEQHDA